MAISPAAIAALCDDLTRWRDRIQTAIGNDSLGWQSFGCKVFDDADGLLARLRMVENAGPLADAIDKEMSDGWHIVSLNVGGNAWKGTSEGKSVISDLELCREFGENVKRRVANALAAVEQLRTDRPESNSEDSKPKRKRTGARRTSEELFKAALRQHHQYDDGSVLNVEPISTRGIETLTKSDVSDSTAQRLLTKHFGSVEAYRTACFSGAIKPKLVVLLGDGLHAFGTFDPAEHDPEDSADADNE